MIFVDSSVWINYFNDTSCPEVEKLDAELGITPVAIGDLVLAEVLQGFRSDRDFKTAKELLSSLTIFNILDTSLALKSVDNFRFLRKKGITVRKTTDVIIATFCIEKDLPLLSLDKDFQPFHDHLRLRNAL
ncbi:MAG TPA: PIN domain nuclease [Gammaproteobacteria bacterium]|nr:PIN domain nuclease [Gammaproteobacteria bacterium]